MAADPRLEPGEARIIHERTPLQVETRVEALRGGAPTDTRVLYIRDNLRPEAAADRLSLDGCVQRPLELSLEALRALPQTEVTMVLQCAGNGRIHHHRLAPVEGALWGGGALACVRFRGVPLRELVRLCQPAGARYLTATGASPASSAEGFERSVPLDDVLQSALVALELNGEPLPFDHGAPLRLVVPGYFAVNSVKWLRRLSFDQKPTRNLYQTRRYRLPLAALEPGAAFVPTEDNSRPCWRMPLKSQWLDPLDGQALSAGEAVLEGVAWSDGRSAVERVEVSLDGGSSWRAAQLEAAATPFAWRRWRLDCKLEQGPLELLVRAFGDGQAQPLDGASGWNPDGYAWNAVERVRVQVG